MPKVNLGNVVGVGVGGGNWNQNDPLGDGYISDRPCYNNQETITWDGDTAGLETFTATAVKAEDGTETELAFYRISERTPSAYDFDGNPLSFKIGTISVDNITTGDKEGLSHELFHDIGGGILYCDVGIFKILVARRTGDFYIAADSSADGKSVSGTIPAIGLYVCGSPGIDSLSMTIGQVKKLDASMLPEGTSPVKVVDIGNATTESIADMDFSAYQAGDVILLVGDM